MRLRKMMYTAMAGAAVMAPVLLGSTTAMAAAGDRALVNTSSGFALAAAQNGQGQVLDGSPVRLVPVNGSDQTQKWIRTSPSAGVVTYQLRQSIRLANGTSGSGCLDLPRDVGRVDQKAGEVLVVRKCDNSNSQRWTKFGVASTPSQPLFRLNNVLSRMSVDIERKGLLANVIQMPDHGGLGSAKDTQALSDNIVG